MRVACRTEELAIKVDDDGVGGADPVGSGIVGLQDRVEALGGGLHLESVPGEGTRLRASLSLFSPSCAPPAALGLALHRRLGSRGAGLWSAQWEARARRFSVRSR